MSRANTYFLSDFHLGARYFEEPRETERRVVDFLDSIKGDAKEVYLLGDILDYWFEYRYVVPRGFTRFFGKIAELTDLGVKVYWFIGNHDIWIFDYLPNELGVEVIDGEVTKEIDGKVFFLAHGDGVGKQPRSFRMLRSLFRNRLCQKLYSAIHPRWTIPFALSWSNSSRKGDDEYPEYKGEENEFLEIFANDYLKSHKVDYFVFGHRHIMLDKKLQGGATLVVLGDWLHYCSYAVWDGNNLALKSFQSVQNSIK
ncbi:MAG: UDP-2,3-diacylglucosamine diphosphatase [bacterium]|nr:UDP-2,3-diacylglucosamine diphosphatase [bacterium]MDY5827417.1 UDP-2,3-diacylglucosamine diphosphatase [Candidatus Limisoma sp.]